MRQKIFCLVFILMLLISSATVLVYAKPKDVTSNRKIGAVHVDASALLKTLGYTEENMSSVPEKLQVQIARSYHPRAELHDDGDYYVTITPDSPPAEVNLIGTNRTSPYDVDLSHAPASNDATPAQCSSGGALDYMHQQRACLVFAVWDYPGELWDIPGLANNYNTITNWITSTNAYDYWHFMTNEECTHYYVYAWITWACAAYESVDVYWMGHGDIYWWTHAYIPYDGYDPGWGPCWWNWYFETDFTTYLYGMYDYSTLRMGVGCFCFGYEFADTFLNPGGAVSHDRAYIGPEGLTNEGYAGDFLDAWGGWWYYWKAPSIWAYNFAAAAAEDKLYGEITEWSYDDTNPIYWDS